MAQKILVVDDERDICEILAFNLENEGYEVDTAHSAEQALDRLTAGHSLILLDVMMGGMSGYRMAEQLRKEGNHVPIIFLTARDTENDMLTGFSVGADDYVSKPFSVKEVVARVRAILKRTDPSPSGKGSKMVVGDLTLDLESKELVIGAGVVPLTRTEYEILKLLASNPSRVYSRDEMIDRIWTQTPYITERTVDVHITRLRKKMGAKGKMIISRPGYGYRLNLSEE